MSISIEPMTVEFFEVLLTHITEQTLQKISLAHYCGDEPDLQRVLIRPVSIKQQAHLSVVYRYQTRDITKNYLIEDAIALLKSWLGIHFKSAHVQASTEVMQWQLGKKNKVSLSRAVTVQQLENTQTHNREKQRYLDQSRPFLTALGITDQKQQIIPAMSRKWKQINKFVEIFSGAFADLKRDTDQPVRVVDFGSGKGYLTFAIRDYIEKSLNLKPQVTGVELRDELVGLCNRVVNDLSLDGLDFFQGDVRSFSPDAVDVMIALHACVFV